RTARRGRLGEPSLPLHVFFFDEGGVDAGRAALAGFAVDAFGHALQIPGEADPAHGLDDIPGRVELPPVEPVARRALVAVVVVVPALASREDRGEHVVA